MEHYRRMNELTENISLLQARLGKQDAESALKIREFEKVAIK